MGTLLRLPVSPSLSATGSSLTARWGEPVFSRFSRPCSVTWFRHTLLWSRSQLAMFFSFGDSLYLQLCSALACLDAAAKTVTWVRTGKWAADFGHHLGGLQAPTRRILLPHSHRIRHTAPAAHETLASRLLVATVFVGHGHLATSDEVTPRRWRVEVLAKSTARSS